MAPCPKCGGALEYVVQNDQYYCHSCQQYQQPAAQAPSPPSPPPKSNYQRPPAAKSKTPIIIAGVVVIILLILASVYFLVLAPQEEGDNYVETMTMDELLNDYEFDENGIKFRSLSPGETLIIEDQIIDIGSEYDYYTDEVVTYIQFKSTAGKRTNSFWKGLYNGDFSDRVDLGFQSDLTDDFKIGDDIVVTLHVINVDYYGYHFELFKEMWDGESLQYLPENCIRTSEPPPRDDIKSKTETLTMEGYMDVLVYGRRNDSGEFLEFISFDPGDTILIEDEIIFIASEYEDLEDNWVTYIWFESRHWRDNLEDWYFSGWDEFYNYDLTFQGDLTKDYYIGDKVRITLNVIEIYLNGNEMEYFEEMWDGEALQNLPESCIKLLLPSDEHGAMFPAIEIFLYDGSVRNSLDEMIIRHIAGDPLDWSKYKMIITDQSNTSQVAVMNELPGIIKASEISVFNATNTPGFGYVDYKETMAYTVEIYNIKENKQVWQRMSIMCA
jgi:hypothetical protein